MSKRSEIALNVYDKNSTFLYQVGCFDDIETANTYVKKGTLNNDQHYELYKINYDENGEEIGIERI